MILALEARGFPLRHGRALNRDTKKRNRKRQTNRRVGVLGTSLKREQLLAVPPPPFLLDLPWQPPPSDPQHLSHSLRHARKNT